MDCRKQEDGIYDDETPWNIIDLYFNKQYLERLVRHQIESYNYFINTQMTNTIDMFNPVVIRSEQYYDKDVKKYSLEINISFENLSILRPQIHENNGATKLMFPNESRLRNFTYASSTLIDIKIKYIIRSGDNLENEKVLYNTIPKVHIGKIPIMLQSSLCLLHNYKHINNNVTGECKYDPGGYFIINGSEKTVLGQERAAENKIQIFNISKNNSKWEFIAEIKSIPSFKCISPKQIAMYISDKTNDYTIYLSIPRVKKPLPLFVIFRALNIISDKDICKKIVLDIDNIANKKILYHLSGSIVDGYDVKTYDDAIKYITNNVMFTPINMDKDSGQQKKKEFAIEVIENDLFPHCRTKVEKIYFLGYMANRLIKASLGEISLDDRDDYKNKRIDLTGSLLNNLYRNYFNKLVKDMIKQTIRELNIGSWKSNDDYLNIINHTNIYKIIKSTTIENGIKRSLSTGDFAIKQNSSNKVGVAQVLNRLTYISSLSHLRRINTPIDKSGKLIPPRKLHNSTWGFLCPAETPEGQSVGVVKNLSYMTNVTMPSLSCILYDIIEPKLVKLDLNENKDYFGKVKVFINGNWIGITNNPYELFMDLKEKKYTGIINIYTSIIFNYKDKEIKICNDAGRLVRPLLRVKDNELILNDDIINSINDNKLVWDDLLYKDTSIIEYIDPEEQNVSMISLKYKDLKKNNSGFIHKYTHCEIHPSTIFGILASCIPFPEHNQSPRNTYQCAMGKQAMGVYVTNFDNRMDKTSYVLNYPHRPLVDTRIMNLIKLNEIPSGIPVIVAIMTNTGYNQEDSIMFNQGSINRGLFQATIYHTEKDEDKKLHGDDEIRCKPDRSKTKNTKFGNYNKLNTNGVIPENTLLENRDVIIGKVIPIKENRNDHTKVIKYDDDSKVYRINEQCYIDKNYIDRNGDGYSFCKVRIRTVRQPVIGDKFSSRHGQKGTIGNIIPEKDMPFTGNGIKPDIIINPHAIPSRMTIAQLKETLLGKVLLELGLFGDGTSFGNLDIKTISNELLKLGYEKNGEEILYNGITGTQIETSIFMGPCFYQRLKHMVLDKTHSRSIGPMVALTRQPAEGRSRDGGLRFGEMERDCMISHGASKFTKGRIYDASDKFEVYTCNNCGIIAAFNNDVNIHICKVCENRTDFKLVKLPYSCKLLFQELITMNIAPRIITN
tara:strand:+ start:3431 stop:6958 length:3528 start_codon:yes stop_codon:yes gene_type:complete